VRPPAEQRVSDLVDALLVAANAISDVSVNDGPLAQQMMRTDTLLVGYDTIPVKQTRQPGLNPNAYTETITVPCWVGSWTGSKVLKPRRDRVTEIVGLLRAGVVADVTIGTIVDRVYLGDQTWTPYNNNDGAAMGARVLVIAETLI
jgi:hypothetical protein